MSNFVTGGFSARIHNVSTGVGGGNYVDLDKKYIEEITIQRGLNSPTTFELKLTDDFERNCSPFNSGSPYNGYITLECFEGEWTPKIFYRFSVKIGNMTKYFDGLIPLNISRETDARGGYSTTITGGDLTRNLTQEDETRETQESNAASGIVRIHDIIAEILEDKKIKYEIGLLDNPPIRKIYIQGASDLDTISQLIDVPVGVWFMDGEVFRAFQPCPKKSGFDWQYKDCHNIERTSFSWSLVDHVNEIKVIRTRETAGEEEFENEGPSACGLQTITFATPRYRPNMRIMPGCGNGTFGDPNNPSAPVVWYWDNNGKQSNIHGGPGPWAGAKFIFYQDESNRGTLATGFCHWIVRFSGPTNQDQNIAYDDAYNIKVSNQDSIAKYGLWPYSSPINNPLIPNSDWAKIHAKRKLYEFERLNKKITFRIALNPWLEPGQTIKITEYGQNLDSERFFVDHVTHNFRNWETVFIASQYPTGFLEDPNMRRFEG